MLDNILSRLYLAVFFAAVVLCIFALLILSLFFPGRCLKAFAAMVYIAHRRLFANESFHVTLGRMTYKGKDRAQYFENPN